MSTADEYVKSVLLRMPRTMPRRAQIGTELQGHIAAKIADGHPVDEVLRNLGDPAALAASYLAEVPLLAAPFGRRLTAKLADVLVVIVAMLMLVVPVMGAAAMNDRFELMGLSIVLAIVGGSLLFAIYTIVAEWRFGQTLGKHLLALRVVQESGAQIGLGQSIVRQLPAPLQIFWIDALFVLFTDRKQRAFEMLSKTRTVLAQE